MGWNSDREPLDYLERRLRYYKRTKRKKEKLLLCPSQFLLNHFGGRAAFKKAMKSSIEKTELRMKQFTEAIEKLKL